LGDILALRAKARGAAGDHTGGSAGLRAQGEDVAEGAGAGVAARLDHDDLTGTDRIEQAPLGAVSAAVALEEILAGGDEAQRAGGADDLRAGKVGGDAIDEAGVVTALAQL